MSAIRIATKEDKMDEEYTPQERAARVAWALCEGVKLRGEDVCRLTGLQPRAARRLVSNLARVLPILKEGGAWKRLPEASSRNSCSR